MTKFTAALTLVFFGMGLAAADEFNAVIKSVKGNKVTINRSDMDNKFKDEVLTAIDKVKVTKSNSIVTDDGNGNIMVQLQPGNSEIKEGLKSDIFKKEVPVRITTDGKNNITAIHLRSSSNSEIDALLEGLIEQLQNLIPDLDIPDLKKPDPKKPDPKKPAPKKIEKP